MCMENHNYSLISVHSFGVVISCVYSWDWIFDVLDMNCNANEFAPSLPVHGIDYSTGHHILLVPVSQPQSKVNRSGSRLDVTRCSQNKLVRHI